MAVEKGLVLAVIERRFAGKSLTKTFKEAFAAKRAAKIETEADIEADIDLVEDLILEASAEGDRRVAVATKKPIVDPAEEGKNTTTEEGKGGETEIQTLTKLVGTLVTEVTAMKNEKSKETISEQTFKHASLKDVPKGFLKGRALPVKAEEIDAWANEAKADYESFATEHKISLKGDDTPGFAGKRTAGNGQIKAKAANDPAVKSVVDKLQI